MFGNQFKICPDNCQAVVSYPSTHEDQDCTAFDLYESQVCGLVIMPEEAPQPSDWTEKLPWQGSINNAHIGRNFGKWLRGVGSVAVPQKTEVVYGRGTRFITQRIYGLVFRVHNLSSDQYQLLQAIQCDDRYYTFWYETLSGHIFGCTGGIVPLITDVDFPLEGTRGAIQYADISIRFRGSGQLQRSMIGAFSEDDFIPRRKDTWGYGTNDVFGYGTNDVFGQG